MPIPSETQQAFAASMSTQAQFKADAEAMGFDPMTLVTLILPIAAEMLKQCFVPPTTRANMLRSKNVFAKLIVDKATAKAMSQLRAQAVAGTDESPREVLQAEVKKISRPVLDLAAQLPAKELRAYLA
jgi:hypothetical protein